MSSTTIIIYVLKPQAIQLFLLGIAFFLLVTTTRLVQQQEQSNMAGVEVMDVASAHWSDSAAKKDDLKQLQNSEIALHLNLVARRHKRLSLRKLASSLSPDYHKVSLQKKADVIRSDVPIISSSDNVYEVIKLAEGIIPEEMKNEESKREVRSVLQSDDEAQSPACCATHDLTAITSAGKKPRVDESAAFHVDYKGPKTHPPKNN